MHTLRPSEGNPLELVLSSCFVRSEFTYSGLHTSTSTCWATLQASSSPFLTQSVPRASLEQPFFISRLFLIEKFHLFHSFMHSFICIYYFSKHDKIRAINDYFETFLSVTQASLKLVMLLLLRHSYIHPFVHSSTYLPIDLSMHSSIHPPSIYPPIHHHKSIHSHIHRYIYTYIHQPIHNTSMFPVNRSCKFWG